MLFVVADGASLYGNNFNPTTLQDDDQDGVINARDACPNTPKGTLVDISGCPAKKTFVYSINMEILFDKDKFDVKPQFYSEILRLADFLKAHPNTDVTIKGFTDDTGPLQMNLKLSKDRALAIADILTHKFNIAANRVKAIGFGEEHPVASNDTAAGRADNRRVVAYIYTESLKDVQKWTIYSVDKTIK